ncbi:MAG: hypothetical protein KDD26_09730 [Winogradskyella sp.]|nr:hypothetical protein [Winogradskyella sp.]
MKRRINYSNIFGLLVGLCFLSLSVVLTIKSFNNNSNIFAISLSLIVFYLLSYAFISTALCRFQHDRLESKRKVQINFNNKEIRISSLGNNEIVLNRDNVEKAEIFYSWNTNPFSSDLGFSKIFLKNKSIQFITQNEIHQSHVKKVLGKLVTEKKSKFKHFIK